MRHSLALLVFLFMCGSVSGQGWPTDYFRPPLGIPLNLSGNFAEMRSNHFHGGLDIRTNGQTGYRVYAAADGWVSRIAVAAGGYGHALYLQHPAGYTTVYGHLERFEEPLASFVRDAQYAQRSFDVNLFPDSGQFPFRQGDVIAYTGNTGSSGGPHLHFEIRDTATSEPLNPLLFGLPLQDSTPPRIFRIKVYAADPTSSAAVVSQTGDTLATARYQRPATANVVQGTNGRWLLERGAHVAARGRIAFGIQAQDHHDGSQSRLGLYTIALRAGEQEIYRSTMDRINFSTQRFINAHVDYAERESTGRWVQRSHLIPGNELPLYKTVRRGYLDVRPGDTLPIAYALRDAFGNEASLEFMLHGRALAVPPPPRSEGYLISYGSTGTFVMPGVIVRFPRGALYEDTEIVYSVAEGPRGSFSRAHTVHRTTTPIQNSITISLEADRLPTSLRDKALLATVSSGRLSSVGGSYENGYVTAQTRSFGTFVIAVDSVAPTITPINMRDGADMRRESSIRFKISDGLSGIGSYEARVDGTWVLFEHDPKNALIYHTFDGRIGPGRHELTLRVTDGKNNESLYRASFTR